ncbi:MAG: uracil-DNA glycosylase [Proteobacteria bacterium]|nr:MAG: uracil-DNA glycosylase [Pseudomonadota bacterium]
MSIERTPAPHDLLAFYVEAGVDCALDEVAADRLAAPEPAPPPRPAAAAPQPRPAAPAAPALLPGHAAAAPDVAIQSAREAARTAATLEDLRALMEGFDGCALKVTASRLVFADGNPQARVMFVGEAPGRDEDLQGLPFVGRSGQLLNRMMAAIGLSRDSAYITNIIPWRPPGNRDPSPIETQICLPFIKRHIELVDPEVLVCLGKPSTQTLLNVTDGIVRTRGRWFDYDTGSRVIGAMPTFHPAYLLRQPVSKRQSWQDFRAIARRLAERTGGAQ